jgi:hypothetical protein
VGLTNLGSESETCVGSRVHLVGVFISIEKNFYRLPFTPPLSGSPYRSFTWTPRLVASYFASSTANSGYHQIALDPDDEDKTTFIRPNDIYFYKVMTFGLKNTSATYQKVIQKFLSSQIRKNEEAYVYDVVIKTTEEDQLIANLNETFSNLL